ncbi:hypothetical protein ACEWY4_002121 [Coilia grayii]|uniref:C1q domain-containing protein n=1 Tax=Coilia grayii TaxID=363190 RepID=A0ABD1KUW3_9TELE
MKTPGAVLLLLCSGLLVVVAESGGVQHKDAASIQQTCQPDIHTVLRDMTGLIAEQRVELRHTKTQLEAMETRLRASEKTLEEQRSIIRELKEKQEEQRSVTREQAAALRVTGSQVEEMRRDREERKVSFFTALGDGYFGPSDVANPLVFKEVITNIGSAYNPNTGVFTAPVRGVYHFVLILYGDGHASIPTGASLYKNGNYIVIAYSKQPSQYVKPSNVASLVLEVGDVVYVKLHPKAWVRDNGSRHTTFSGHLLFTM